MLISHATQATLRTKLALYEGRLSHLYLDSVGKVTVGVGHMMPTVSDAKTLDFKKKSDATAASAVEIERDWKAVVARGRLSGFNQKASSYAKHTKLRLPDTEIDRLTNHHISTCEASLVRQYSGFAKFPVEVQLALFDMIFNLGPTGLHTKFPKFKKAVKDGDWKTAVTQSKRLEIGIARNRYVSDLFLKAARDAACTAPPQP